MTSFGVRQSLVEILKAVDIKFDNRLVSGLVEKLADVNFDPAVLQIVCSLAWEHAVARESEGDTHLTLEDLEAVGGLDDVFGFYLGRIDQEVGAGDARRRVHCRAILDALVSAKGTKLALTREDLSSSWFAIAGVELEGTLDLLGRHQLIRTDPVGGRGWVELVHERLINVLRTWLDSDPAFFRCRAARNLVAHSCRNEGWRLNPELLLNRGQLDDTVGPYRELLRFNEDERVFLVSSAVYGPSRDLPYWVDLAGHELTHDLLEKFLEQGGHERLRKRAAQAAAQTGDRPRDFAVRCLRLALEDPSGEVRAAAARSFSLLALPAEFEQLRQKLGERATRSAALEVLAATIENGRVPRGVAFGRWRLRQARKRLHRRRLDASIQVRRERARRGAMLGLRAGFVWMATAGALLSRAVLYEVFPDVGVVIPWAWPAAVLALLVAGGSIGAVVGLAAAQRVGEGALRTGREGAFFRGLSGRTFLWCLGGLWIVLGTAVLLKTSTTLVSKDLAVAVGIGLMAFQGSLATFAWVSMIARAARASTWRGERRWHAWLWAWPWAFGGSLVLPLLVWACSRRIPESIAESLHEATSTPGGLLKLVTLMNGLLFAAALATLGGLSIYAGLVSMSLSFPGRKQARAPACNWPPSLHPPPRRHGGGTVRLDWAWRSHPPSSSWLNSAGTGCP